MAQSKQQSKPRASAPKKATPAKATKPAGQVKDGFVPPMGERKFYHLLVWRKARFDPVTGKKTSQETMKVMEPNEYKQFIKNADRIGYEYELYWDPTPYLITQKA